MSITFPDRTARDPYSDDAIRARARLIAERMRGDRPTRPVMPKRNKPGRKPNPPIDAELLDAAAEALFNARRRRGVQLPSWSLASDAEKTRNRLDARAVIEWLATQKTPNDPTETRRQRRPSQARIWLTMSRTPQKGPRS